MIVNADVGMFVSHDFAIVFDSSRDETRNQVESVKGLSDLVTKNSFEPPSVGPA